MKESEENNNFFEDDQNYPESNNISSKKSTHENNEIIQTFSELSMPSTTMKIEVNKELPNQFDSEVNNQNL